MFEVSKRPNRQAASVQKQYCNLYLSSMISSLLNKNIRSAKSGLWVCGSIIHQWIHV